MHIPISIENHQVDSIANGVRQENDNMNSKTKAKLKKTNKKI